MKIGSLVLFSADHEETAHFYRTLGMNPEHEEHADSRTRHAAQLGPIQERHRRQHPRPDVGLLPVLTTEVNGADMTTHTSTQLANPLTTNTMEWIPSAGGKSFKPLRFEAGGWTELMRLDPGSLVARHRHTGDVHAFNLTGTRNILSTGEIVGPGDYVYEPAGNIDTWQAIGDEPCIVHIKIAGAVQYLDDVDTVIDTADAASQRAAYLDWCQQHGQQPDVQILNRPHARIEQVQ